MLVKPRGASLITVLLLFSLLLVLGLALLTKMHMSDSLAQQETKLAEVRNLALSGLADFRLKIGSDSRFPPSFEENEKPLSYEETLRTSDGRSLGRFEVLYSLKYRTTHKVIVVVSTGMKGDSRTTLTGYLHDVEGFPWLGLRRGAPPDL